MAERNSAFGRCYLIEIFGGTDYGYLMNTQIAVLFLTTTMLMLSACRDSDTSDNGIRKFFFEHRADFQQVADALLTEPEPFIHIYDYGRPFGHKFDIFYQYGRPPKDLKPISPRTLQICKNFINKLGYDPIEKQGEKIVFEVFVGDGRHNVGAKWLEYEKGRFKNSGTQNSEIVDKKAISSEGYSAITPDWGIDYLYDR